MGRRGPRSMAAAAAGAGRQSSCSMAPSRAEASMAREIGFVETFALAEDRGKTLAELIPGSDEYYYYSCLHAEQRGAPRQEIDELLKAWIERGGVTQRVIE